MRTLALEKNTATVSSKGQVTIPKQIRDELKVEPGSEIRFVRLPGGRYEIVARTGDISDLFGILKSPHARPSTIEELRDAAADGWAFGEPDESTWALDTENDRG